MRAGRAGPHATPRGRARPRDGGGLLEQPLRGRREVLEAARFPEIRFEASGFEPGSGAGGAGRPPSGSLQGTLTLHGTTQSLSVPVQVTERADGAYAVKGRVAFKRSDYGVRTPNAALGTVGVKDRVELEFELALVDGGRPRPAPLRR
jgi:polyisoprenoid-binding protein YceI